MKTYENIKNANQVKKGNVLVEFYFNSNEVWHSFQVNEVKSNGIELHCQSGALLFVSNETLSTKKEYFKRIN